MNEVKRPRNVELGRGRGLAALIPTTERVSPVIELRDGVRPNSGQRRSSEGIDDAGSRSDAGLDVELISIDPAKVSANPRQPRRDFDPESLEELASSIREVGMLQPVVVRRVRAGRRVKHELVAGERRLRAARLAGLDRIPAIVRGTADEELLREALLENLQRVQLNPLEEGAAYEQLLGEFGITHEELARKVGKSRSHVSNMIRLLRLPASVQSRVAAGVLSGGHARAVLSLDDFERMELLSRRIVAEGLSVRAVEEIIAGGGQVARGRRASHRARGAAARPEHEVLAQSLSDQLDTRVRITAGRHRGRITIEFADDGDFHRITRLLGQALP